MSVRADTQEGTVFILLTEEDPTRAMRYRDGNAAGDEVFFQIQIDQFNTPTLERFAKTPAGRTLCNAEDYSFVGIFDTAKNIGVQVCGGPPQKAKPVKPPPPAAPSDTTTGLEAPVKVDKTFVTKWWPVIAAVVVAFLLAIGGCVYVVRSKVLSGGQASNKSVFKAPPNAPRDPHGLPQPVIRPSQPLAFVSVH
jgi:hypothetical protein